ARRAVRGDVLPPAPQQDARPQPLRLLGCRAGVEVVLPVAVVVVGDETASLRMPELSVGVGRVSDTTASEGHPVAGVARLDVVALLDVLERDLSRRLFGHGHSPLGSGTSTNSLCIVNHGTHACKHLSSDVGLW